MTETATTEVESAESDGPELLQILTDVELAVLGANGGAVVTPFLDSLEAPEGSPTYDAITRTAFRGLLARGLMDMPSQEVLEQTQQPGSQAPVEVVVRDDVATITAIRENALALVAIARTTEVGQDFWYAHLIDTTVLLEEVGSDGLHRYTVVDAADLAEWLRLAAIMPDAADGTGEEIAFDPQQPDPPQGLVDALGSAYVRCDVVLRTVTSPEAPLYGVFTGPSGSWVVPDAEAGVAGVLHARPATVAQLGELLDAVAGRAVEAARLPED